MDKTKSPMNQSRHTVGKTLLIVDDDPVVLTLTADMLTRLGYIVIPADNPESALEQIEKAESSIHLLITDVIMPEMNGFELYEKVQEQYPALPVLFISGYTANNVVSGKIKGKKLLFLEKPFSLARLDNAVRKSLRLENSDDKA